MSNEYGGRPWRRRLTLIATVAALLLIITVPAWAITFGEPDGDGHPNVGALVFERDGVKRLRCSGTLIAPAVFLTASHCTAPLEAQGITQVWVTFDSTFDPDAGTFIPGTMHSHPEFGFSGPGGFSEPHDIAVIVLDVPAADMYPGIEPASLPMAGLFNQMAEKNGLKGQEFTAVGYGVLEPTIGGGPPTFPFIGERRVAVSSFAALNDAWLRLSQNNATGDGGTCFGDSGGPNFLGAGDSETDIIAGITVTGDAMCLATNVIYRLDTPSAREFLGQFVALP